MPRMTVRARPGWGEAWVSSSGGCEDGVATVQPVMPFPSS